MPRERDRAGIALRKLKRAEGLTREARGELAALANGTDVLGELELTDAGDVHQATELLELLQAQYGPVHLTVVRAAHPHHGAPEARRETPA